MGTKTTLADKMNTVRIFPGYLAVIILSIVSIPAQKKSSFKFELFLFCDFSIVGIIKVFSSVKVAISVIIIMLNKIPR